MLAPVLEDIQADLEAEGVTTIKVNVDLAQDIAMEYRVMSIPTMYIIENGEAKASDLGFKPGNAIMNWVKSV